MPNLSSFTISFQIKFTHDCLVNAIYEQVHSRRNITTPGMLRRQAALYLVNHPHIFFNKVQEQLLNENESYQSYCINIFNGTHWGEPIIAAALSHMWNVAITIVTATKYRSIKLFHKSDKPGIVLIANGYYNSSSRCTHYAATELYPTKRRFLDI